jgi:hypothetical protein
MRRHLRNALIVLGSALLIFALMGYKPPLSGTNELGESYSTGASYPLGSRVIAAFGAAAIAAGVIIRRRPPSS